jgi:hypothetical protein
MLLQHVGQRGAHEAVSSRMSWVKSTKAFSFSHGLARGDQVLGQGHAVLETAVMPAT